MLPMKIVYRLNLGVAMKMSYLLTLSSLQQCSCFVKHTVHVYMTVFKIWWNDCINQHLPLKGRTATLDILHWSKKKPKNTSCL